MDYQGCSRRRAKWGCTSSKGPAVMLSPTPPPPHPTPCLCILFPSWHPPSSPTYIAPHSPEKNPEDRMWKQNKEGVQWLLTLRQQSNPIHAYKGVSPIEWNVTSGLDCTVSPSKGRWVARIGNGGRSQNPNSDSRPSFPPPGTRRTCTPRVQKSSRESIGVQGNQ